MRKYPLVLLCFALAHAGVAQNLDSLRGVWNNTALHDTIRLEAFGMLIVRGYMNSQPDSAYILAQQLTIEASKMDQPRYIAKSVGMQGHSWFLRGDLRKGADLFLQAGSLFAKVHDNRSQCKAIGNAASMFIELGEYDRALATFTDLERATIENKDTVNLVRAYNGTGRVYTLKGDIGRASEYLDRALRLAELKNYEDGVDVALAHMATLAGEQEDYARSIALNERRLILLERSGNTKNKSDLLANLGAASLGQKDYTKAIVYYSRALEMCKNTGYRAGEAGPLIGLAQALSATGAYEKGLERIDSGLVVSRQTGSKQFQNRALVTKGGLQLKLGDTRGAITSGEEARTLAIEVGIAVGKKEAAGLLFQAYRAVGDNSKALAMHIEFTELSDSLLSQENKRALLRQEYRYDYEKMALADSIAEADHAMIADLRFQAELGRERSNRYIIIVASAVVFALVLLLGYTLFKRRQQERKLAAIEMERLHQENVIGELRVREQVGRDIHDDMGAGLSALKLRSEMALETEPDPTKRLHFADQATIADELMGSMRQIIWAMNGEQSNVEDLVLYTAAYARNYCAQNNVALEVANAGPWPVVELTADQRRNLFLVVKETLHNMVKHAGADRANLRMEWANGLTVEVADNGKGLSLANDRSKGNGLQNMEKRVTTLGGELIIDGTQGTRIRFHVPLTVGDRNKSSVVRPTG